MKTWNICAAAAALTFLAAPLAFCGDNAEKTLTFERQRIGTGIYEAGCVMDVNHDKHLDIVSGEYWYEGPDFTTEHKACTLQKVDDYYDDFSDYPMDVNGDGYLDIVSGGWFGCTFLWRENPKGQPVEWPTHEVAKVGNIERACFYDLDKDGIAEVIPVTKPVHIFKLKQDDKGKGAGGFDQYTINTEGGGGHGFGAGDLNGDGKLDFVFSGGWFESPENPFDMNKWVWHPEFDLGSASVPVLVHDVNEDGRADLIWGAAHDYGLWWMEQGVGADGKRTWTKHDIDPDRSQYHEMQLVDIDKDGKVEMITGKRYRAHAFHDPGSLDPLGLYYFEINKGEFKRVTIDYGPAEKSSGAGIYLWFEDIDKNGWLDILAPGKEGVYLFKNLGFK